MKKTLLLTICLALAGMVCQPAMAGDKEWATAGKILTGVVGASILADALDNGGGYYQRPAPSYRYAAPAAAPVYQYETARPIYYNSRSLSPYPSHYDEYPRYGGTTVYYEEEYTEPVSYRRRTVTRTY